jgi:sugar-phosphatase
VILPCAAVLFDVDGTLVDSTPLVERAAREWAAEYGIDPEEFLADAHGRRTSDRVAEFLPPGLVAEATARLDALESTGTDGITALPGAVDLLAGLGGLPHAFVTSMDRAQLALRTGVAGVPLPPTVVTAEDVPAGKPDRPGTSRRPHAWASTPPTAWSSKTPRRASPRAAPRAPPSWRS